MGRRTTPSLCLVAPCDAILPNDSCAFVHCYLCSRPCGVSALAVKLHCPQAPLTRAAAVCPSGVDTSMRRCFHVSECPSRSPLACSPFSSWDAEQLRRNKDLDNDFLVRKDKDPWVWRKELGEHPFDIEDNFTKWCALRSPAHLIASRPPGSSPSARDGRVVTACCSPPMLAAAFGGCACACRGLGGRYFIDTKLGRGPTEGDVHVSFCCPCRCRLTSPSVAPSSCAVLLRPIHGIAHGPVAAIGVGARWSSWDCC